MTLPKVATSIRVGRSRFAELEPLLGPEQIGVTGDNRYRTLYGRPYALALTEARRLRLYRGAVDGGAYQEVTSGLPEILFGPAIPPAARRFTAAFDQSARITVAYELDEVVRVTRWTGSAYVQNVTFAGVDPALLMDATLADPRGYPNLDDDGWSVREAFEAGIPVLFEWLPGDPIPWLENAIPDSDVLLFYLTPDRLELRVRVQRQLYATPRTLWTFDEPVVLDRVIALAGRYQALVSDARGDPLPEMIVSDPYLGDFIINPRPTERVSIAATPEPVETFATTYAVQETELVAIGATPEAARVDGNVARMYPDPELVSIAAEPQGVRVESTILRYTPDAEEVSIAAEPLTPLPVVTTTTRATPPAELVSIAAEPVAIIVKEV